MDKGPGGQNGGNHCCKTEYKGENSKKKKKDSVRKFWDNIKCTKGSHKEKREREKGLKKIFEEIIAENFPNMG